MRGESSQLRRMLKGYMFEVIILKMLEKNGFELITIPDNFKIREQRKNFIEVRGRGGWHQIDCPCDYNKIIPFMYPIRLLGEVKYYSNPINKEHIREFIGIIKDIQENYFVPDDFNQSYQRVSELGVFFSANGFDKQAERLAFAHNIKTVSYENNYIIGIIKGIIDELENNYLPAKNCISNGNLSHFIEEFKSLLNNGGSLERFQERFNPANGFKLLLDRLVSSFQQIRSSFIASTSGGAFIHFLGFEEFPEELFNHRDEQLCRIHFENNYNINRSFYLTFTQDINSRKFYFTPPMSLEEAAFFGSKSVLNEKERIFKTIHVSMKVKGINRSLEFKLDNDWIQAVKKRNRNNSLD